MLGDSREESRRCSFLPLLASFCGDFRRLTHFSPDKSSPANRWEWVKNTTRPSPVAAVVARYPSSRLICPVCRCPADSIGDVSWVFERSCSRYWTLGLQIPSNKVFNLLKTSKNTPKYLFSRYLEP